MGSVWYENIIFINCLCVFLICGLILEKYINHSFKTSITFILHVIMYLFVLYFCFIVISYYDDDKIFDNVILGDQIDKVSRELEENTDIKITGKFPENKFPKSRSIRALNDITIITSIMIFIFIIFYIIHRRHNIIDYDILKYNIIPLIIFGSLEILFSDLIGGEMIYLTNYTDVTQFFLDNILKYSTFVP